MAHEIDVTTGQAAFFSVLQPAWHGLGKVLPAGVNGQDAIREAILDWTVERVPVQTADDGVTIPKRFALRRSDTKRVLSVVGANYVPLQNNEVTDILDAIVGDGQACYETGGSLKGGERVFFMLRIPKEIKATESDIVLPYLLATNGHDYKNPFELFFTGVRVVCYNTLTAALYKSRQTISEDTTDDEIAEKGARVKHHKEMHQKIVQVQNAFAKALRGVDLLQEQVSALVRKQMDTQAVNNYFNTVFPVPATDASDRQRTIHRNIVGELYQRLDGRRQNLPGISGTAWSAFNAVTEYIDHEKKARGKNDSERASNRMESVVFGKGNDLKRKAMEIALAI